MADVLHRLSDRAQCFKSKDVLQRYADRLHRMLEPSCEVPDPVRRMSDPVLCSTQKAMPRKFAIEISTDSSCGGPICATTRGKKGLARWRIRLASIPVQVLVVVLGTVLVSGFILGFTIAVVLPVSGSVGIEEIAPHASGHDDHKNCLERVKSLEAEILVPQASEENVANQVPKSQDVDGTALSGLRSADSVLKIFHGTAFQKDYGPGFKDSMGVVVFSDTAWYIWISMTDTYGGFAEVSGPSEDGMWNINSLDFLGKLLDPGVSAFELPILKTIQAKAELDHEVMTGQFLTRNEGNVHEGIVREFRLDKVLSFSGGSVANWEAALP